MRELATLIGLGGLTALMFVSLPAAIPLVIIGLAIKKRRGRWPWKVVWIWLAIMIVATLLAALGWSGASGTQ